MRFTQEDLLKKLEIEVDKPFMCDGEKLFVSLHTYYDGTPSLLVCNGDGIYAELSYLLGKEITQSPKYTLTEDEKRIVLGLSCGVLKRWNDRTVAWEVNGFVVAFFLNSYFNFITEPVSLDELQQIAKGETK